MYENIVITLILIVDLIVAYMAVEDRRRKAKARTRYHFNRILKSVGLR